VLHVPTDIRFPPALGQRMLDSGFSHDVVDVLAERHRDLDFLLFVSNKFEAASAIWKRSEIE
jgi:hypothetical protein